MFTGWAVLVQTEHFESCNSRRYCTEYKYTLQYNN